MSVLEVSSGFKNAIVFDFSYFALLELVFLCLCIDVDVNSFVFHFPIRLTKAIITFSCFHNPLSCSKKF